MPVTRYEVPHRVAIGLAMNILEDPTNMQDYLEVQELGPAAPGLASPAARGRPWRIIIIIILFHALKVRCTGKAFSQAGKGAERCGKVRQPETCVSNCAERLG